MYSSTQYRVMDIVGRYLSYLLNCPSAVTLYECQWRSIGRTDTPKYDADDTADFTACLQA